MKLLFIIGMHRSGTSVLTSYIETLGYNIGKNRNQDKNWQNPKGYWENNSFTHFHDNLLLKYNNLDWSNVKNKDLKYTKNHVKEYSNLIKKEFESEKIVIKDPRLSFFVDFLLDVSKELQADIKFIFATRNKEECTISLNKAQNLNLEACKKLFNYKL